MRNGLESVTSLILPNSLLWWWKWVGWETCWQYCLQLHGDIVGYKIYFILKKNHTHYWWQLISLRTETAIMQPLLCRSCVREWGKMSSLSWGCIWTCSYHNKRWDGFGDTFLKGNVWNVRLCPHAKSNEQFQDNQLFSQGLYIFHS